QVGSLNRPTGVGVDGQGRVLVADTQNNRVLRQESAGSGNFPVLAGGLNRPRDVAEANGKLFVTNTGTHQIMEITSGTPVPVAGTGTAGFNGDGLPATQAAINLATPADTAAPQLTDN